MKKLEHSSKAWMRPFFLATVLCVLTLCPLRAQVVNDSATNSFSNVTNTIAGDVTVGTNGSFTLLIQSDNSQLNSDNGTVGLNATAKSNEVQLVSSTARWLVGNHLFIGSNGSFNRLVVSNGATVRDFNGSLGWNDCASNNLAVVTGPGSVWNHANVFHLGFNGPGNQLVVSNGGVLQSSTTTLGVTPTSRSNIAVVSGLGSTWTHGGTLLLSGGGGNQLAINNGGVVQGIAGSIGSNSSSSNNVVSVTGSGSTWITTADLHVGPSGAGNRLLVSAGAAVRSLKGHVGANAATASNNLAIISDAGSVWSNAMDLSIGASCANNHIVVSNGGTLVNAKATLGVGVSEGHNSALVTGPGSSWSSQALYVGETGTSNRLVVSNGALVQCAFAEIGRNGVSAENEAVITGSGSTWTMPGIFFLGDDGSRNRLVVSNGATLHNRAGYVGGFLSSNNIARVTGSGSLWTNAQDLNIGLSGLGNLLVVNEGARVVSSNGVVGSDLGSSGNIVQIIGPGAVWTNTSNLYVGRSGSRNQLVVTNGASVFSGEHGYVGYNVNASNNLALVTGVGSTWLNAKELYVGYDGSANQLVVSNGGMMLNRRGVIGENHTSNNLVIVSGAGSVWSNTSDIVIGRFSGGNELVVTNGGKVECTFAALGANPPSSNNTALISGTDSLLKLTGDLYVGYSSANRLTISNGASLSCFLGYVGFGTDATNNTMVITGAGSRMTNRHTYVGSAGSRSLLVVTNGGLLRSSQSIVIGEVSTSSGNRLLVHNATLLVTNAFGTGVLDVRSGTNVLNTGYIEVDRLSVTNAPGRVEFNAGTLITGSFINNNGRVFEVGANGALAPAVLNLAGNGAHFFANGLTVKSNGTLLGNGTILGTVTVQPFGTLSPGSSIGKLTLNSTPSLNGTMAMEISKDGMALTSDQVEVTTPLTYNGSLVVTKLGAAALGGGDRFQLFSAIGYSGSFSSIMLPPLNAGLTWTNKLAVDGSIEVVGGSSPYISSIVHSGTNLVLSGTNQPSNATYFVLASTNIALPLTNWTRILTNQFDSSGHFSFTNAINPTLPRRFFMLEVP